jgi:hypothetical protein
MNKLPNDIQLLICKYVHSCILLKLHYKLLNTTFELQKLGVGRWPNGIKIKLCYVCDNNWTYTCYGGIVGDGFILCPYEDACNELMKSYCKKCSDFIDSLSSDSSSSTFE